MLFTYVFLLGFFISTAVCQDESQPHVGESTEKAEEHQPEEVDKQSVQETTTTTAPPSARSKPPQSPQPSANPTKTTKSKGNGVKGFAKKFAGAVTKGSKKAFKATKDAAKTVKNKVVKKK